MENPEQVMSEVLDDRTDLLICDLEHSFRHDVTALRNCRRVRPRLPLIILTSTFDEAFRTEVLPIGIHYYMTRDFEPTELLESVRSALGIVKQAR
jgi:DNA-binding NarL/FixJ family response regulator